MQKNNDHTGAQPGSAEPRLYSIGHSNHELVRLLELLRQAGITAVVDVRSRPFSVRLPHFCRPELRQALEETGIAYAFLGDLLGGRPEDPDLYDETGRVDYEKVRRTTSFRRGLEQLCGVLAEHRVAMLCAEEDPLDCHRGLMIAPALAAEGIAIAHLRGDGCCESAADIEKRLLDAAGLGPDPASLFGEPTGEERAELLSLAYREQARRRAFRLRAGQEEGL
jgi:uncharacterized protein (DUF488 family)